VARIVPERSIAVFERLGGPEARDVAERYYDEMNEQAFADFLRVCFPLLSSYELTSDVIARADWNPEVLMRWMAGEAKVVDLRGALGAVEAPALVLAGEDDAWAPLESVREAADLLTGPTRFRSFTRARHSVFRDAPEAYEELRLFLDDLQLGMDRL
jgi:pimeloyl-ACP methyl ester carboxylesterase